MSLKDEKTTMQYEDGWEEEVILLCDLNKSINSYLDAVEHPDKYPGLFSEYKRIYWTARSIIALGEENVVHYVKREIKWRDFCFKHFIGGRE